MQSPIITAFAVAVAAFANAQKSPATAPDGRRGFGGDTRVSELLSLFHSSKDEDRAFLSDLAGLATEIDVIAASALESYRSRGYLAVLAPAVQPSMAALNARYAELAANPFEPLVKGDAASLALAHLLADTRFRARARVLDGFEFEERELVHSLAVLRAATDGYVVLEQHEATNITTRADLSASLLRAMRSDLLALREALGAHDADLDVRAGEFLDLARASEGENVRRAGVQRACEDAQRLEDLMTGTLFTARLRDQTAALLEWRRRLFDESIPLRAEALEWLPDTEEGRKASDAIQHLAKFERMRGAGYRALKGLAVDPLDDQLAWICAHAADFQYGLQESRPWYDRFLALHKIRAHDQRTYAGRTLEAREKEALDAVQRSYLPPPPRPRGG